jgi:preprotein translocase subunit SecD
MSLSRLGVLLLLLSAAFSCGTAPGKVSSPAHTKVEDAAPKLEFAVEPLASENVKITRYQLEDSFVDLGPRRSFRIVKATVASDALGFPALGFQVASEERDEFRQWTAAHVDKRLGIFLDGRLTSAPTIMSALPGSGILDFGAHHQTREQVQALADRFAAASDRPVR